MPLYIRKLTATANDFFFHDLKPWLSHQQNYAPQEQHDVRLLHYRCTTQDIRLHSRWSSKLTHPSWPPPSTWASCGYLLVESSHRTAQTVAWSVQSTNKIMLIAAVLHLAHMSVLRHKPRVAQCGAPHRAYLSMVAKREKNATKDPTRWRYRSWGGPRVCSRYAPAYPKTWKTH